MADVAGLFIGVVTLTSLFFSTIELFDIFELSHNYVYDYQLACTKIKLLRARLVQWGDILNVTEPGHEDAALRGRWLLEKEVIAPSLLGIQTIFNNSAILVEKYKLVPKHNQKIRFPSLRPTSHQPQLFRTGQEFHQISSWSVLRKRTAWAIHDKGKFDNLIQDLSFLIENLEKVVERSQTSLAMSNVKSGSESTHQRLRPIPLDSSTGQRQLMVAPSPLSASDRSRSDPNYKTETWSEESNAAKFRNTSSEKSIVSGAQTNTPHAVGLQGSVGSASLKFNVTGPQKNSELAFGLQGSASAEDIALLLDRAYHRKNDTNQASQMQTPHTDTVSYSTVLTMTRTPSP